MSTDVPSIISTQQGYVTSWVAQADAFINAVAQLANSEIDVDISDGLAFGIADVVSGAAGDLASRQPQRPQFDSLGEIGTPPNPPTVPDVETIDVTIPDFTGVAPTIDLSGRPSLADFGTAPTAPSISSPVIPTAPTLDFPTAPAITAVAIPDAPSIELPSFTSTLPIDDLVTPSATFAFAEQAYQSTLLDTAKSKLLDALQNGGYGIEPADEQALFERTRARELQNMLGEAEDTLEGFAARGFPLEPGESAVALGRVYQRTRDKIADANRTITLERSRLYVENRQFSLREARELETVLVQFHTALMERTLNAAKATLDASIAIYNTTVARYNARLTAYQAEAQVFEQRIRAALSQVEIYKARVEAANLALDVQKTGLEIYRAQLAGIQSLVDIYRVRMEAANVQASVERTRIDAFRTLVDAFAAGVQAKVAEFTAYESEVRAQVSRVDAFRGEVEAYRARTEAARAMAETQVANANTATERARITLTGYQAQIAAFSARADAAVRRIGAEADVYRADTSAFSAIAEAIKAVYQLQLQQGDNNIRWNIGVQEAKTKIAIANIEKLKATASLRLGASEFGTSFYKDVVAATLGSINTLAATIENV